MDSQSIREAFTSFFVERGHSAEPRSSLVPNNDPTLLFTNAGMVQFKDVFLGSDKRSFTRATTCQPCVRAGGKHNDLDNVGYTARHHTFFEMLGNFSFGDYFKEEAINFAWDFLTKVVKLPAEKLWVTVFEEDDEAADIWLNKIGVDKDRFSRIGAKDNFWQMGDTGPCGPCTEIFYDHGPEIAGGPPGTPEEDGDRYIEIWNLVFMQYDRDADGNLNPLPKPSVDTGMGLERLAAILQGVHDNYDIDTFVHLIGAAANVIGTNETDSKSLRVIADHIRSTSFLITDGVVPSNEGRGYVLRRIIRRAIRHGESLGADGMFFHKLVDPLIEAMGKAYPELAANRELIIDSLKAEETQFLKTLAHGLKLFEEETAGLKGNEIPGETVFKLYDTYGFPVDLTEDLAREREMTVDMPGFEKCMEAQRERARASSDFKQAYKAPTGLDHQTEFTGYDHNADQATLEAIYVDGNEVDSVESGANAQLILNKTPFYAESGGQVGDTGLIKTANGEFVVTDTQKHGDAFCHLGHVAQGAFKNGDAVEALVNHVERDDTRLNHSATHLLHAALREVLGDHVQQKGSLVDPERLRFDFSHSKALTDAEVRQIEDVVNAQIRANHPVETIEASMDEAKDLGAMMLFGEKYGDSVRVLRMGEFSVELCGGTHARNTGDIGLFKLVAETGIAAGVRRIEAVTGQHAFDYLRTKDALVAQLCGLTKASEEALVARVEELQAKIKTQSKQIRSLQIAAQGAEGSSLADKAEDMGEYKLLVEVLAGADPKALRDIVDDLKKKLGKAIIVLGIKGDNKVNLICGVTDNLTDQYKASDVVNHVAVQVGGKGGGRADMAQAGGSLPNQLDDAMLSVKSYLTE